MFTLARTPDLTDALLVYSLRGWVDAGLAGEGTIEALIGQMDGAEQIGGLDLTDLLDLQQVRPHVGLDEGGLRSLTWPEIEVWTGSLGRDLVVVRGPEPSLRWPSVAQAFVDLANRLRVAEAVAVGGMPAFTTHRRPVPILASAAQRSLAQELGDLRDDYDGPTGFNTVIQHALGVAGLRSAALWAQVPQYVAGSACPPAVRALLARIAELYGVAPELATIDRRSAAYRDKVEEGLAERPDVRSIVDQLDRQLDAGEQLVEPLPDDLPSGDELADEIEQFLRGNPEVD